MTKRFTQEDAETQFKSLGFNLLSKYNGTTSEVILSCQNKHVFKSTYKKIKKNPTCKECKKEKTLIQVKSTLNDNGFELVSEYTKYDIPITVKCKKGHVVDMFYDNIKRGNKCKICSRKVLPEYEYIKNFIQKEGYSLISDNILSATQKFSVRCPKGHQYEVNWNKFSSGRRCPHCQNKIKISKDEANKVFMKYGYEIVGDYIDTVTPVLIKCPKGHEYKVTLGNFKSGKRCRECGNNYKGELKIRDFLEELGEDFKTQYKFKDCKNIFELPFDFYLPKYNLCIEYDGVQHDEPVEFFGGEEAFKERKLNDNIKNKYCKDNNINLLRISYKDKKHINEMIKQKITNLK